MKFRPVSLLVAGSMALGALAVPAFASAQTYGYNAGPNGYDPCVREARQRQTTGALLGAVLGAAAGSSAASRGVRTEGGALGAAVGAVIGAQAGKSSAACGTASNRYGYGGNSYGYGSTQPYYGTTQPYGRDYGYNRYPYGESDYERDDRSYDYRRPVSNGSSLDGCRLAESPIYLPDGRTEKRYVRVCPDENGRYRVVD